MINLIEKGILINFLEMLFVSSFTTSSARLNEFDSWNKILFKIKVFNRNIKEITLMRCFIKVTARSSFTRLRAIRWINRAHYHNENILERFTCISLLFKPPCCQTILTLFLSSHQAILTLSQVYCQLILTLFLSSYQTVQRLSES